MTNYSSDYQFRNDIWTAFKFYPEGDESWANKIESENPLASWIASPSKFRYSRWVRIAEILPEGWTDLLDVTELSIEDILTVIPDSGPDWQDAAVIEIKNRFLINSGFSLTIALTVCGSLINSLGKNW